MISANKVCKDCTVKIAKLENKLQSAETAIKIMNDGSGTQFDPIIVDALLKVISRQKVIKNTL